jgi:hypothetical protein
MYRQFNERAGISIEQNTQNVPEDSRYYVLEEGKIVKHFRSLKAAQVVYQKLVDEKGLQPLMKPAKLPYSEILCNAWALKSNESLLRISRSGKSKKSGRFHKTH